MSEETNVVQMFKMIGKPIQDKGSVQVTGSHNIVGNNNTTTHHVHVNKRPNIDVSVHSSPGTLHITEPQCAEIKALVGKVATASGKSFQFIYNALFRHLGGVTMYRLIPLQSYEQAELYLRKWLARVTPKADNHGLETIKKGIFAEFKKRSLQEQRKGLISQWTGKPSITVLTEYELLAVLATVRAMPLQS